MNANETVVKSGDPAFDAMVAEITNVVVPQMLEEFEKRKGLRGSQLRDVSLSVASSAFLSVVHMIALAGKKDDRFTFLWSAMTVVNAMSRLIVDMSEAMGKAEGEQAAPLVDESHHAGCGDPTCVTCLMNNVTLAGRDA